MILQAYGPLVLNSKRDEPPIFSIMNKEKNSAFNTMLQLRNKVPQPIKVKLVSARCLKDKVGSGHFIIMCSILDRIGGKRINDDMDECEDSLRYLSQTFRSYNKNKRDFINKEHREMKVQIGGEDKMVAAPKTG